MRLLLFLLLLTTPLLAEQPTEQALALVKTARSQVGVTTTYLPGDIVTCTVPPNLPHIMIVSDKKTPEGTPLVIHNIGSGTKEENSLFSFPLTGHYRWFPAKP